MVTLEDPSCVVLTRNQQNIKPQGISSSSSMNFKGKEIVSRFHNIHQKPQESPLVRSIEKESLFDIVEFCKSSKIQITPIE